MLKSKHFMFLILAVGMVSIITYPSIFIATGGRNTWIFTTIASILVLIFVFIIFNTGKRTKNYDFVEICHSILGKFLGRIYLFLFSILLILTLVENASVNSSAIHSNLFLETPVWYALAIFVIAGFLIGKNNFSTIVSIVLVSVTLSIIALIILFLLTHRYKDFRHLLPILQNKYNIDYVYCTLAQLGSLSSFVLVLPIVSKVADKENLKKHSLITLAAISVIVIWAMIGVLTTFGPIRGENIYYPIFLQAQRISYGGFIENGELLLLLFSTLISMCKYILCICSLIVLWKIKNKKWFVFYLSIVIYILSYFSANNIYILFDLLKYYQYALLILLFIVPLLIYICYGIRYKDKKI